MNKRKFTFEFTGKEGLSRSGFFGKFHTAALEFLNFPKSTGFSMLLNEIIKNIYDHGEGKGLIVLTREKDSVRFVVKDCGEKGFGLAEIKRKGSAKAGNGGMIESTAKDLGISLSIDTSKGFTCAGSLPLKQPRH